MRRAIKDKLNGVFDDPRVSNTMHSLNNSEERRNMAGRVVGFVREKGGALATTVQEHVTSVTDTTGTLAKQKLLQTLFSSGVVQSEHIRHALQLGSYIDSLDIDRFVRFRHRLFSRATNEKTSIGINLCSTRKISRCRWYYTTTCFTWFRHRSVWSWNILCSNEHLWNRLGNVEKTHLSRWIERNRQSI